MLERFTDWCHSLEPEWVGFTVWMSVLLPLIIVTVCVILVLGFYTKGWAIPVVIALPVVYSWYVALFKQP